MAAKTTTVRARLEPGLKEETESIFEQLGLTTTDAIRLFFMQVKLQRGMPFEIKIPNKATLQAIDDAKNRKDVSSNKTAEDLFDELDI